MCDVHLCNHSQQLEASLNKFGNPWQLNPGDGAFYGPKVSDSRLNPHLPHHTSPSYFILTFLTTPHHLTSSSPSSPHLTILLHPHLPHHTSPSYFILTFLTTPHYLTSSSPSSPHLTILLHPHLPHHTSLSYFILTSSSPSLSPHTLHFPHLALNITSLSSSHPPHHTLLISSPHSSPRLPYHQPSSLSTPCPPPHRALLISLLPHTSLPFLPEHVVDWYRSLWCSEAPTSMCHYPARLPATWALQLILHHVC